VCVYIIYIYILLCRLLSCMFILKMASKSRNISLYILKKELIKLCQNTFYHCIYLLDQYTTGMPCIRIIHCTHTSQWTVQLLSTKLTTTEMSSTTRKLPTFSPVYVSKTTSGHKPFCVSVGNHHGYLKCLLVSTAPVGLGILFDVLDDTHLDTPHSVGLSGRWSAGRRDLYLTTRNTKMGQTSMLPQGFEPAIPASERPQTTRHHWHRPFLQTSVLIFIMLIQGVPGGMCQISGECSLC